MNSPKLYDKTLHVNPFVYFISDNFVANKQQFSRKLTISVLYYNFNDDTTLSNPTVNNNIILKTNDFNNYSQYTIDYNSDIDIKFDKNFQGVNITSKYNDPCISSSHSPTIYYWMKSFHYGVNPVLSDRYTPINIDSNFIIDEISDPIYTFITFKNVKHNIKIEFIC